MTYAAAVEIFRRNGRAIWSLLLLLAALALLADLHLSLHFKSDAGELGPGFWPQFWLWVLLALSALDLVVALREARRENGAAGRAPAQDQDDAAPPADLRLVVVGALFAVAYAFGMMLVGFVLATVTFLIAFARLGGYRRMATLSLIALASTLVLLVVFVQVVYISLPLGWGPFVDLNVALYRLLGIF